MTIKVSGRSLFGLRSLNKWDRIFVVLAGAIGGAIAVASMVFLSIDTAFPLVFIPFATSIVTVLGSPNAEPAQPRALIGGHLISTFIGLVLLAVCGSSPRSNSSTGRAILNN